MIELEINEKNLKLFLKNLRTEDRLELEMSFNDNLLSNFIEICFDLKNEIYLLGFDENAPVALGGVYRKNKDIGQIWLLCCNNFYLARIELFKYILNKINHFKSKYKILYNVIYKTNFSMIKFLKKAGFQIFKTENDDFKLFIFRNGENENK